MRRRDLSDGGHHVSEQRSMVGNRTPQLRQAFPLFGNDEQVRGRLGINVLEDEHLHGEREGNTKIATEGRTVNFTLSVCPSVSLSPSTSIFSPPPSLPPSLPPSSLARSLPPVLSLCPPLPPLLSPDLHLAPPLPLSTPPPTLSRAHSACTTPCHLQRRRRRGFPWLRSCRRWCRHPSLSILFANK